MPAFRKILLLTTVLSGTFGYMATAQAAEQQAAPESTAWTDSLKFYGHAEGGVAFNPASPANNENVGHLFTDKSNQLQLNQLMLAVERPIDPTLQKFDFGFKLQALFGTDARYTHSLAETDHLIHSKYQFDFIDASVNMHLPVVTEGGIDLKIGQFPSPMGAESIAAPSNSLYSHSYIFNFGVPMKNTGVLATAHVTPMVDLYGGLDTGVNGGITETGNMNRAVKGQFGVGLNLLGGDLTVVGLSHVGAENAPNVVPGGGLRYLNDITTTYKATDKLTFVTDVNYIRDDGLRAIGYGAAQYATYALNDHVTLVGRGEVWRDNSGAFAGVFPANFDASSAQRGIANTSYTLPRTTYGEITLGVNYKPDVPKAIEGFSIRPELRVDHSLNGSKPYNQGKDATSFTPAIDIVVPF